VFFLSENRLTVVRDTEFLVSDMYNDLTPYEAGKYQMVSDSKKNNWLLGRFAAKGAIIKYVKNAGLVNLQYSDIEIRSGNNKPPTFLIKKNDIDYESIIKNARLSLSHSKGVAVAQVISGEFGVRPGVDVEKIRTFSDEIIKGFCTDEEYLKLKNLSSVDLNHEATLYWCLKESYLKALGVGLCLNPKYIGLPEDVSLLGDIYFTVKGTPVATNMYWTVLEDGYIIASIII